MFFHDYGNYPTSSRNEVFFIPIQAGIYTELKVHTSSAITQTIKKRRRSSCKFCKINIFIMPKWIISDLVMGA